MTDQTFNRRQFLKTSLAAGSSLALPSMVTSPVFGAAAPSNRVTLGAIGTGSRAGVTVLRRFAKLDNVRVVAACDCFRDRREQFANKLNEHYGRNVCKPYLDYQQVLHRDDIDGVIVSTPDHWHAPIAIEAARANKDMYVEKPLSTAMQWNWQLREEMQKRDLVFQYGTHQRSMPHFRKACELAINGYIGELKHVAVWCPDMASQFNKAHKPPYGSTKPSDPPQHFAYDRWLGPAPKRDYTVDRCTRFGAFHIYDYSLGFIAGWGVHPLDIAQWGLGMDHTAPVHYEGSGRVPSEKSLWNTIEHWDVTCRYENGLTMRYLSDRLAKDHVALMKRRPMRTHGTTFHGSEGWISVDRAGIYMQQNGKPRKPLQIKLAGNDRRLQASNNHQQDFVNAMRKRRKTVSPLEVAIRDEEISHMCDIAVRTDQPVQWDPSQETLHSPSAGRAMLDRPMRSPWSV
jgi:predicted dehydrogenase